jgi:hypothetical protein
MRVIERRTRVSRRLFLRGSATAVPAAAVAAAGVSVDATAAWAANAANLTPHSMTTLVKVARDIYPHDRLADSYYLIAVTPYDALAADADKRAMLEGGVARLDADAHDRFGATYVELDWEADRLTVLRLSEDTPFFQKLRGDLVVSLYNQKPVWAKFGYEGSSAEHGGYIHRGFDDIDWLAES